MLIKKIVGMCIILLIAILIPASAQTKETLAVLDFTTEAVSKTEMSAIVEFLSNELFKTDKYIVIDVSQRETILQEMEFSMQGCSDDSCALEIGKMLSAELIVVGTLSKIGSRYLMSAKMLQTETSRTVGTANGKYADLDEMIDGLETIAYSLSGQELASAGAEAREKTVPAEPEAEPEPEAELQTAKSREVEDPEKKLKTGTGINWLSFGLSAAGIISTLESGIFGSLGLAARFSMDEAYDIYLQAEDDPGYFYEGVQSGDYEEYYKKYQRNTIISYSTAAAGGLLNAAAGFVNDTGLSSGGRISAAAGIAAAAIGNASALMAANKAVSNVTIYENYIEAVDPDIITRLYNDYENAHSTYKTEQYVSYGMWGIGGLLQLGAWFIPGEINREPSGLLQKIISSAGYLLLSGGGITGQLAVNARFNAERVFDDYESAGTAEIAAMLYDEYETSQTYYELMTYASYGLWTVGSAAVIASLWIPSEHAKISQETNTDFIFSIRPVPSGFSTSVHINLK